MSSMHLQYHSYIVLIDSYVQHVSTKSYKVKRLKYNVYLSYIVLTNSYVHHVSTKSYKILVIFYVQHVSTNFNEL